MKAAICLAIHAILIFLVWMAAGRTWNGYAVALVAWNFANAMLTLAKSQEPAK